MLLAVQLLSTLAMTGLIWFVQIVHYPLFSSVGHGRFRSYADAHARRTTFMVAPLMFAELISSVLLLFHAYRPSFVSGQSAWTGAGLVALLWLSTACLQVPLHNRLQHGFDPAAARRLTATNWVRTAAWSLRAVLVLGWSLRVRSF